MREWKLLMASMTLMLVMTWVPFSFAAVSPDEAAKLGTTLTGIGAEMAGNADGTIPPYTGGLTTPPANFVPGSGIYPDPFAAEKPLFSVNAQNMAQYADKLSEGTKAIMKKHSTFRIDVYKTHRTVVLPDNVLKNTAKNALKATTYNGGLSVKGARAGIPFPIPKTGYEVMWNHLLRYSGRAIEIKMRSFLRDVNRLTVSGGMTIWEENPYYDEDTTRADANIFWKFRCLYDFPPRKAGEAFIIFDPVNMYEKGRVAYQYLPGQRRVKLAPELGFDTPNSNVSGLSTFDESYCFNGSMERYDFKLIGKKEVYIPYNAYRAKFQGTSEQIFGPKHLNPDFLRWELHRVWVVEATLKPGKRHIYPKRRLYIDEDSWIAHLAENYDAKGFLQMFDWIASVQLYDAYIPEAHFNGAYNLIADTYMVESWAGASEGGYNRPAKVRPERDWTPASLAGQGIR